MAMTQMNTRIDERVKRKGDDVFKRMGLNPSDVVRAVWEYAAEHDDAPAIVGLALKEGSSRAPSLEARYRESIARAASELVANYRTSIGAVPPDALDVIDYRALREEAWSEKLTERGLA